MDDLAYTVLEEIQKRSVKSRKTSNGVEYRFRCPMSERHAHGDSTPSADYNADRRTWHCHACGAEGGLLVGAEPLAAVLGLASGLTGHSSRPAIYTREAIRQELEESRKRVDDAIQTVYSERLWQRELMARDDILASLERDGISEWAADYFGFGFGYKWDRPTLYIPWTVNGELCAVQYRFTDRSEPRYMFERGTMGDVYNADVLATESDCMLIVEGAKKVASLWSHGIQNVTGIVSKSTWKNEYAKWYDAHDRVIVVLDPDAQQEAREIAGMIHGGRVIELPAKPDDFLVHTLGGDIETFWAWIKNAKRA